MKDFRGKVVVVTGAAMGIGRSLAEKAVQEGCRGLVVADIGAEQLEETAAALRRLGSTIVVTAVIDASKLADVQRLLTTTLDHFGDVNLACFNAGVGGGCVWSWPHPARANVAPRGAREENNEDTAGSIL